MNKNINTIVLRILDDRDVGIHWHDPVVDFFEALITAATVKEIDAFFHTIAAQDAATKLEGPRPTLSLGMDLDQGATVTALADIGAVSLESPIPTRELMSAIGIGANIWPEVKSHLTKNSVQDLDKGLLNAPLPEHVPDSFEK